MMRFYHSVLWVLILSLVLLIDKTSSLRHSAQKKYKHLNSNGLKSPFDYCILSISVTDHVVS